MTDSPDTAAPAVPSFGRAAPSAATRPRVDRAPAAPASGSIYARALSLTPPASRPTPTPAPPRPTAAPLPQPVASRRRPALRRPPPTVWEPVLPRQPAPPPVPSRSRFRLRPALGLAAALAAGVLAIGALLVAPEAPSFEPNPAAAHAVAAAPSSSPAVDRPRPPDAPATVSAALTAALPLPPAPDVAPSPEDFPAQAGPSGDVTFQVEGPGGAPLDAELELLPPPGATAPRGPLRTWGPPLRLAAGLWTVVARAEGFAPRRVQVSVHPDRFSTVPVALAAEQVVVLTGVPEPERAVGVVIGPPGASLVRDSLGMLTVRGLPAGAEASVLLRLADGSLARAELSGAVATLTSREPPARIEGFVTGAERASLEVVAEHEALSGREASVAALDEGAELLRRRVATDAAGFFRLEGLPAGTWRLQVGDAQASFRLRPGETRPVLIRP